MRANLWLSLIVVLLIVVVGGAIRFSKTPISTSGGGIVPGIGGGPGSTSPQATINPFQYRMILQILLTEQGILAVNHLNTLYDGKDTSITSQDLDNNSQKIASIMKELGADSDKFLKLWRSQITSLENYANALKNNDKGALEQIKGDFNNEAMDIGNMVNQTLPSIPSEQARKLMEDHINLTLSIIEAHSRGDKEKEASEASIAAAQAVGFANTLADGIEATRR